ncbi:MAG: hypothetical protein ACP5N9_03940 [Candidatus Bilamarchaeum sp.]
MQLQHGARTGFTSVPSASSRSPFSHKQLAVEIRAGEMHIPPMPVVNDYLRRERGKRRSEEVQLPLYIDDTPPPGWRPEERPPRSPDAERGVFEIQF